VGCIDAMTALRFRLYGFTLVSTKHWFRSFPVRPHALLLQSTQRASTLYCVRISKSAGNALASNRS
jgi:hypothetical protein